MPLKHVTEQNRPYLITWSVNQRQQLFSNNGLARSFLNVLARTISLGGFSLHAYVVMPDHIHLIVSPQGERSLGDSVKLIKGRSARSLNAEFGAAGTLWQEGFYDTLILGEKEYHVKLDYVHFNPVRAGLVRDPREYPWSSYWFYCAEPLPICSGTEVPATEGSSTEGSSAGGKRLGGKEVLGLQDFHLVNHPPAETLPTITPCIW